jgi:hypothetical protein
VDVVREVTEFIKGNRKAFQKSILASPGQGGQVEGKLESREREKEREQKKKIFFY